MSSFVLSLEAERDLEELRLYLLAEAGADRAQHVLDELERAMEMLAKHPGLGHARPDLADETLCFGPVWSYLVVYRPEGSPLGIARVLHGHRDLRAILRHIGP